MKYQSIKLGIRKICKVNCSRTISLPKVWLDTVGLDVGDHVEIEMTDDGSLMLKPIKVVKP